jgi:hypothetical protein
MRASLGAGASISLYLAVIGSVVALLGWSAFIWISGPILSVWPMLLAAGWAPKRNDFRLPFARPFRNSSLSPASQIPMHLYQRN